MARPWSGPGTAAGTGRHIVRHSAGGVPDMMGRSHILSGLIAGTAIAGVLPAPMPVRLLVIPVAGGAALLPDLDHRGSKIARSLGPVTRLLAEAVNAVSLAIYDGTATEHDRQLNDGHRTATHTIPGCLAWGVGLWLVGVVGPPAVRAMNLPAGLVGLPYAVCLAVLISLMGSGLKVRGFPFAGVGLVSAWWITSVYPAWSWVWPVVVSVGAVSHVLGDTWTTSGVPIAWPLVVQGERWHRCHAPRTFGTGKTIERTIVTPLLYGGLFVTAGLATGGLQLLARAAWAVASG